jgi:hypothetical protein
MKLAVALLSILVGCEASVPPVANPTPPVASSAPPAVDPPIKLANGARLAVVKLIDIAEEGSGMGGTHFTFDVDEPGARSFVHGGGHGFALVPPGREQPRLGYYLVEILPRARPFRVWDGGWGLGHLPTYTGVVLRAVPIGDRAEAFRLLPYGFDRVNRCAILDLTVDLPEDAYEVPEAP